MDAKQWAGLVVAGGVLLGACGGGGSSSKASEPASTAPTSTTTTTKPAQDVAADKAAAEAASLKLADFPTGWTSAPQSNDSTAPQIYSGLARCLGVPEDQLTSTGPASIDSPDFSDTNNNTVSDHIGYTPDAATAAKKFAVLSAPTVPNCFTTAVKAAIDDAMRHPSDPNNTLPPNTKLGTATVKQMSFPTFGDQTVAYQIEVPISVGALSMSLYLDEVLAVKGRVGTTLSFEAVGSPFASDQEEHYVGLVVGRLTNT